MGALQGLAKLAHGDMFQLGRDGKVVLAAAAGATTATTSPAGRGGASGAQAEGRTSLGMFNI